MIAIVQHLNYKYQIKDISDIYNFIKRKRCIRDILFFCMSLIMIGCSIITGWTDILAHPVVYAAAATSGAGTTSSRGLAPFYTFITQQLNSELNLSVNAGNGNLVLQASDLHISGTALDLSINRYYSDEGPSVGTGGVWWMSTSVSLSFNADGSIIYQGPTGISANFEPNGSGGYFDPLGLDATLSKIASNGGYQLTIHGSGEVYKFDSNGRLITDQDKNGNQLTYNYNSTTNLLATVVDTQGRTVTFTYNASSQLTTITDPIGRTVQYTYDNHGNLVSSIDTAGNTTTYTYGVDNAGYDLLQITDPLQYTTKISYATATNSLGVSSVTDPTGATASYAVSSPLGTTVVTDKRGNKTTYTVDSSGRITKVTDVLGNQLSTTYSSDSHITSATNALQQTSNLTYDANNNLTSSSQPSGGTTTLSYGDSSHPFDPTNSMDQNGHSTAYTYDSAGNPISAKDATNNGTGATTTSVYNANGTLASRTDPDGHQTTYRYDSKGNLTQVVPPSPLGSSTFTLDVVSRVTSVTDGNGNKTSFTYDALDRTTKITYADSSSISYVYDADGNLTSTTDDTGTSTFLYDRDNRLVQETLPGSITLKFAYDAVGNMTSYTDAGGTVTYAYDARNLLSSETDPTNAHITFGYNTIGQRTSIQYPNGIAVNIGYDAAGHETSIVATHGSTTLAGYSYSYGSSNLVQSMADQVTGLTTNYSYDSQNELLEAKVLQGSTQVNDYQYSYDKAGNRISQTINGVQTTYNYNAANQLTQQSVGGTVTASYVYDGNGNLTSYIQPGKTSITTNYAYNLANQMVSATIHSGALTSITNAYAYAGSDQTQRVQADNTTYVNSPLGVGSQTDSSGTTYFTRDAKGSLVSERTPAGTYYYLFDGLGSAVGLTDTNGNLIGNERYVYDPYGDVTNTVSSQQMSSNPWRFVSGYFDSFTGFVKFGLRYDNPAIGRWTQQDPVTGNALDPGSLNRYAYAKCNPTNMVDPTGGQSWWDLFWMCITSPFFVVGMLLANLGWAFAGLIGYMEAIGVIASAPWWLPWVGLAAVLAIIGLAVFCVAFATVGVIWQRWWWRW